MSCYQSNNYTRLAKCLAKINSTSVDLATTQITEYIAYRDADFDFLSMVSLYEEFIEKRDNIAHSYRIRNKIAEKQLTTDAQHDRDVFDNNYSRRGCSCHISPPCSFCTHPGNPVNQAEDDECWEIVYE